MKIISSNKAFINLLKDYSGIYGQKDLIKRKLTPYCITELEYLVISLAENGAASTIIKDVANYCKKFGLKVKPESIGWSISL